MPPAIDHRLLPAVVFVFLATTASVVVPATYAADRPVDYARQIKPLLSDRCYACHGPDSGKRQADLRLDVRKIAVESVIKPGDADGSYLVERIAAEDPADRMPPAQSNKPPLTKEEIELVRRWINEGAKFDEHWAYVPPKRPPVPEVKDTAWPKNGIDRFVAAGQQAQGLSPSPEADRRTLIRRLSLDLLGLPPAPEEADAFAADSAADAYDKLVERLLASPHFGERMAVYWLDVARYADTGGYHSDNHRDVWLYRDFVIRAFNENEPFDQFITEQLAGDLLPGATRWQRIASGYNRLLQTTEEGGAQPKEYQAKYDADRVRNTSAAFLGATMACAECHNHKFDPYTMRDFYSFAAFFADIQEKSVGRQDQTRLPTPEQEAQLAKLDSEIAAVRKGLDAQTPELDAAQARWEQSLQQRRIEWAVLKPADAKSSGGAVLEVLEDGTIAVKGPTPEKDVYTVTFVDTTAGVTGLRLEAIPEASLANQGPGRAANGNFVLNEVELSIDGKKVPLTNATATHSQEGYAVAGAIDGKPETGWAILPKTGNASHAVFETASDLEAGRTLVLTLRHDYGSAHTLGRFRLSATTAVRPVHAEGADSLPQELTAALAIAPDQRNPQQKDALAAYYRSIAPELAGVRKQLADLEAKKQAVLDGAPTSLVSISTSPRTVRILPRGNWLNDSGDVVAPAIPAFLGKLDTADRRPTRLDLARWMTGRENPLLARVFVNRLWKLFFGQGIVKTADDFGTQGSLPSHPELLDWLAVEWIESGWDVKHMVRLMVTSATYRQSSQPGKELRQRDPGNVWLARQGRFRLAAEFVRDNALAISGLLSPKIGGPSVKPYQPAGYWFHLNFPKREYVHDHGEDQYRRGLYTYWQRTFLHPSLLAFDASSREECTAERARSNTPLQSLVLLNDPTYVEAARVFAARILRESGPNEPERIAYAFRRALGRRPQPAEQEILSRLYHKHYEQYARDEAAVKELLAVGEAAVPEGARPAELAAWTSVARTILNLHETITRY
ncbi:MAG: DUF1553 domain-containing protein [Pirellulales bacterium]|nr:DUF1553 domain-containing protein [Pirellulales bacterium]